MKEKFILTKCRKVNSADKNIKVRTNCCTACELADEDRKQKKFLNCFNVEVPRPKPYRKEIHID